MTYSAHWIKCFQLWARIKYYQVRTSPSFVSCAPGLKTTKYVSVQVLSFVSENKKMPTGIKKGIIEKYPQMIISNNIQRRGTTIEQDG
jgi:hypothetical protein